jgi:REP element-mobilizing transposase RayT
VSHTFVVMPNHVHGIVGINLHDEGEIRPTHLTVFLGSYKSAISRRAGRPIWQRSCYDHIVRDDRELEALWLYIDTNPARWAQDHENPDR